MLKRKRITTSIDEKALKQLDIKIINSDYLKDRGSYFELLIKLLPFIPDDVKPDADAEEILLAMHNSFADENGKTDMPEVKTACKNPST